MKMIFNYKVMMLYLKLLMKTSYNTEKNNNRNIINNNQEENKTTFTKKIQNLNLKKIKTHVKCKV